MAKFLYVLLAMAMVTIGSAQQIVQKGPSRGIEQFCYIKTCERGLHTLCKFDPRQAPTCGKVHSFHLTEKESDLILNKHNELRAFVAAGKESRGKPGPQPPAKYLGPMKWNKKLAKIAQTWANQCIFGHDDCRNTGRRIGQNIAFDSSYDTPLTDLINMWYNEVVDFDRSEVQQYTGKDWQALHYSQLVWAKSNMLGCGVIRFNHPELSKGFNRTQLVCNYGIAGNTIGEPVYLTG